MWHRPEQLRPGRHCSPSSAAANHAFTASPTTIDRVRPTGDLDPLVGDDQRHQLQHRQRDRCVPCNSSPSVGPSATTTYTFSASGAGGGPVPPRLRSPWSTATHRLPQEHLLQRETEFCRSQPISATSSADAQAACEGCYERQYLVVLCRNILGAGKPRQSLPVHG